MEFDKGFIHVPYYAENNPWAYIRKFDHLTIEFVDQI